MNNPTADEIYNNTRRNNTAAGAINAVPEFVDTELDDNYLEL